MNDDSAAAPKVVGLFGPLPEAQGKPDQKVVEFAKDLLARAERGEVLSLAVAAVGREMVVVNAYVEGEAPMVLLVAAATRLQHRLMEDWGYGSTRG